MSDFVVEDKEQKRLSQIQEIKQMLNVSNGYDPSHFVEIKGDYQSKERYSKKTMTKVLNEINEIKSIFPAMIINEISEYAQGKIVCCAECKNVEFDLECDGDLDGESTKSDDDQQLYAAAVLTDDDINDIIESDKIDDLFGLKEKLTWGFAKGYKYMVLCKDCRYKYYCNEHLCILKCIDHDGDKVVLREGSKKCVGCKGIFCKNCNSGWEDWGFADNSTTCTTCGWVIKKQSLGLWRG